MVYIYRYLCQLVNEPQVHRCTSAQCDELNSDICPGTLQCHLSHSDRLIAQWGCGVWMGSRNSTI